MRLHPCRTVAILFTRGAPVFHVSRTSVSLLRPPNMNGVLRTAFALSLAGLRDFALSAVYTVWSNGAGGYWSTAPNWSPNQVPAASDTAVISNSGVYTVTVDANMTVSGLRVGGAEGGQTLIINGPTLMVNGE